MVDELAEDRGPFLLALVRADPEGGKALVREAADALGVGAAQHIDDVLDAEALIHPVHAGQGLLCVHRSVEALGRVEANVAVAALGLQALPEIAQQHPPPAGNALRETRSWR